MQVATGSKRGIVGEQLTTQQVRIIGQFLWSNAWHKRES
jgi:hypothetical protein